MKKLAIIFVLICGILPWSLAQRPGPRHPHNRIQAIKFGLFSPLMGSLKFGYERMLIPGFNLEAQLGAIGNGIGELSKGVGGMYLKGGIKILIDGDKYREGLGPHHPLKGMYFRPDLGITYYRGHGNQVVGENMEDAFSAALIIHFGEQWIIGKVWLIDISAGVGVGIGRVTRTSSGSQVDGKVDKGEMYYYSHAYLGSLQPIALAASFNVGYLLR